MTVKRYDIVRIDYEDFAMEEEPLGEYVAYCDYASLNEKLRAAWQEHFLLSRENATLLKERIRLSKENISLQSEIAEMKALLEPRVSPLRVWQD